MAELAPSMQVIVACGIALDALYDMLRPHAKITDAEISKWKKNKTGRGKQVAEVIRRIYKLDNQHRKSFLEAINQIFKFRDLAVHPSLELKNACDRPDISVGVDWKFSAYRYSSALNCYQDTMKMLIHLYEKKSSNQELSTAMENVVLALEELGVVTKNSQQPSQAAPAKSTDGGPTPT